MDGRVGSVRKPGAVDGSGDYDKALGERGDSDPFLNACTNPFPGNYQGMLRIDSDAGIEFLISCEVSIFEAENLEPEGEHEGGIAIAIVLKLKIEDISRLELNAIIGVYD